MKIAVISRSTIHHFASGGMETHLKNLVEGLVDVGHFVEVITTSFTNSEEGEVAKKDSELDEKHVGYYFIGDTTPGLNPLSKWELIFYKLGFLKVGAKNLGSKNFYHEANRIFHTLDAKDNFDVLISQSTSAKYVVLKRKIPVVSIIHGTIRAEIENRIKTLKTFKNIVRFFGVDIPKWIVEHYGSNRKFYSRVDLVVAVSNDLKKKFVLDYPVLTDKTAVIYNGVDMNVFHPARHPEGEEKVSCCSEPKEMAPCHCHPERSAARREGFNPFRILYVGRMDREKGVDILLDAIVILVERGIKNLEVDLIGKGVHLEELKDYARSKKLIGLDTHRPEPTSTRHPEAQPKDLDGDSSSSSTIQNDAFDNRIVNFLGQMNNSEIVGYYQRSSVFVFPTRRQEGHPMTLSEAFCCGLPIICTKGGGLVELIDDGVNGYFVEMNDPKSVANKIEILINDKALLKQLSQGAFDTGVLKFSRDSMIKNYIREIQKI